MKNIANNQKTLNDSDTENNLITCYTYFILSIASSFLVGTISLFLSKQLSGTIERTFYFADKAYNGIESSWYMLGMSTTVLFIFSYLCIKSMANSLNHRID